jgi:hypothetical protein
MSYVGEMGKEEINLEIYHELGNRVNDKSSVVG